MLLTSLQGKRDVAAKPLSVRKCASLHLAKTEDTGKLQTEMRPNSRPVPASPCWRPSCRAHEKRSIRSHPRTGGQARTTVSWTTHQRAVASPFHETTTKRFRFTEGRGEWLAPIRPDGRIRRGRVYGDVCFCLLGHRSEASRQGIMQWVGL